MMARDQAEAASRSAVPRDAAGSRCWTSISNALRVQQLLRAHGAQPRTCTSASSSTGARSAASTEPIEVTRPGARTLSAVPVPLPQEERRAADLPQPARAAGAVARVVPLADAAESHPAQPGLRAGTAAAGTAPAQARPHGCRRPSRS